MSYGKHTRNPGYQPGNYWLVCDRCGFDYRLEDMVEEWTGAVVCRRWCYEPRHPQDLLRGFEDDQSPRGLTRTEPDDEFVDVTFCNYVGALAGYAEADCARAGNEQSPLVTKADEIPQGTNDGTL